MLFRILINIMILLLLVRLLRPVAQGVGRFIRRVTGGGGRADSEGKDGKIDYSDLTPYEIEDADFEEVKGKQE